MNNQFTQLELEQTHSEKIAFDLVMEYINQNEQLQVMLANCDKAVKYWAELPAEYEKKAQRKEIVKEMDLTEVIQNLFVTVLTSKTNMSLANASGVLAAKLHLDSNTEAIKLAGEIIAIIGITRTGCYVLDRDKKGATYYLVPNYILPSKLIWEYHSRMYIPPMLSKPKRLRRNSDSPYEVHNSGSLILKPKYNYHNKHISLDVLNRQNAIPLMLDTEFLDNFKEQPDIDKPDASLKPHERQAAVKKYIQQLENFKLYVEVGDYNRQLMLDNGNKFYIPNKVDKRGRIYAQGYYIDPMGNSFNKASVSLYNEEHVEIPEGYFD